MMPDISIIIPFKNESRRLPDTLATVMDFLQNKSWTYEVVLVDDGSTDDTMKRIESYEALPHVRLLRHDKNLGKGAAIQTGVRTARGRVIFFTDADLSTPIEEIDKLMHALENGADIAIGSRGMEQSDIVEPQHPHRIFIGKFGNALLRHMLGLPFKDTQCGFKAFRQDVAKTLFQTLQHGGWSFDFEILYRANKRGLRITEVPVSWKDSKTSKFRPVLDSVRCFLDLLAIRFRG